jgi:PncC family amidohydrolase
MRNRSIERRIHTLLHGTGVTVATAESCTGGLVSYRITSVAGSSDYFAGGIVAYTNELKHHLLGVSNDTLQQWGAVSEQCAREMADGARRATGATIAVSTTGIAGPGGATHRKPVGLIYFGCASPAGVEVLHVCWRGDRIRHMRDAANFALRLIINTAETILSDGR